MNRNDSCWCGSGKKYKKCHLDFDEKIDSIKFNKNKGQIRPRHKLINNAADIEGIKKAATINTGALDLAGSLVKEGIDTLSINDAVHEFIVSHGAHPSCLGFENFPKSICISVNNVVCHGIPSKKTVLKSGDILNIDITTDLDGYFADASRMFFVGEISAEAKRLIEVTREIMEVGILAAKPWHFVGDIGAVCGKMARENGYSVVTDLGGHGCGKDFHLDPFVSHDCAAESGMLLVPGMSLTVEPMINMGRKQVVVDADDGWTVRTRDGSLSAQWEKTILITETGNEVLAS
ncbi:MAG: type I methionyl aminopeptidase [Selenomonadaceae bacterium]|nr:type I methionyl aminopeptidase [Selenomonadaceae bacterium]